MDSTTTTISVLWESDREFKFQDIEIHNKKYHLKRTLDIPDLRIFDATHWNSFEKSNLQFKLYNCPNIVICRKDDAIQWLKFLSEYDGICLEEEIDNLLPHYITRVFLRNDERKILMNQSRIDQLTGLNNRVELQRQLDLELESVTEDDPLSILMIDMDNFKNINDLYGHALGDYVLKETCSIIRKSLSFSPKAYRIGGNIFVILIRMNKTQASALAEFIRKEIEENKFKMDNQNIRTTVSIGHFTLRRSIESKDFLEKSDLALYQAKALGRNCVVSYNDYAEELTLEGNDPEIKNFENRIRVLTERLTNTLTSKSKQLMSQIKMEADHDGLTGLYIRRYFDNRISREFDIAKTKNHHLSLIFIDIDHFGMVNKTYGFPTGDQALRVVSQKINESIRDVDWAARYGGEELCIILPNTEEDEAYHIAKRIWNEIGNQNLKAFDGRGFLVTVSIGVAELNTGDKDLTSFIQRTSDRTRYAKEHGRNQICRKDRI